MKLAELKEKYIAFKKWRHPLIPEYALVTPNYMDKSRSTNGLTQCIIAHLHLMGWQAERISSSGRMIDNTKIVTNGIGMSKRIGSKKWIKGTTQAGTADISASPNGRIVKIEVKNEKTGDRMSEAQKRYKEQIELSGGIYYIARNYEETAIWIDENFTENPHKIKFWNQLYKKKADTQMSLFSVIPRITWKELIKD